MGTRGLTGFVIDGVEKLSYVHHDAYPAGLGVDTLKFARSILTEPDEFGRSQVRTAVLDKARALVLVEDGDKPTPEQQQALAEHADTSVSTGSTEEWYVLLRNLQGELAGYLDAGFMSDDASFAADSLFNEGTYLIDFDEGVFEAYTGFVTEPHNEGRFARLTPQPGPRGVVEYYPIRLIGRWPLTDLPTNDEFITHCENADPEDD